MKSLVKEVLEKVVGKSINNETHAITILKNRLIELDAEDFANISDDIPSLLEFLEIYDPEISQFLTVEFWNVLHLDEQPKRTGKILLPKKLKMDRDILTSVGEAITGMHPGINFVINISGITFLKNNRVICVTKRWRKIEGPIKEYSAEVVFNQIRGIDRLKELIPEKYTDGKKITLSAEDYNKPYIRYLTVVELIDTFTNNKIVEESCLKDG